MSSSLAIAMVGPDALKDAYTVLLQSGRKVNTFIYASGLAALRELSGVLAPDLIILHVARSQRDCKPGQVLLSDLAQIIVDWPGAISIALVDDPRLREEVETQGIDLGLLEGISPARLLKSIEGLLAERQSGPTN